MPFAQSALPRSMSAQHSPKPHTAAVDDAPLRRGRLAPGHAAPKRLGAKSRGERARLRSGRPTSPVALPQPAFVVPFVSSWWRIADRYQDALPVREMPIGSGRNESRLRDSHHEAMKRRSNEAGLVAQDRRWMPWCFGLKPISQQVKAGEKVAPIAEPINRYATTPPRSCAARAQRWDGAGSVARPAPRTAGRGSCGADARPHVPPRSPARNPG